MHSQSGLEAVLGPSELVLQGLNVREWGLNKNEHELPTRADRAAVRRSRKLRPALVRWRFLPRCRTTTCGQVSRSLPEPQPRYQSQTKYGLGHLVLPWGSPASRMLVRFPQSLQGKPCGGGAHSRMMRHTGCGDEKRQTRTELFEYRRSILHADTDTRAEHCCWTNPSASCSM